jgi:hypothetical protein
MFGSHRPGEHLYNDSIVIMREMSTYFCACSGVTKAALSGESGAIIHRRKPQPGSTAAANTLMTVPAARAPMVRLM